VAHYRSSGDKFHARPWTLNQFTPAERQEWVAGRKGAGDEINIETCEIGWWFVSIGDPYGVKHLSCGAVRDYFVRSAESRGWVWDGDLPGDKLCALRGRIERQRQARQREQQSPAEGKPRRGAGCARGPVDGKERLISISGAVTVWLHPECERFYLEGRCMSS
jgi:hypothetical protein